MDSVFLGSKVMLLILNQTRVGQLDVSDISQSMQTMPVTTLGRNGLM